MLNFVSQANTLWKTDFLKSAILYPRWRLSTHLVIFT